MTAPVSTVARITTRDGQEVEEACSFTPSAWHRLSAFATYADELAKTTLLSGRWQYPLTIRGDEHGVRADTTSFPDPDHLNSLLMHMRPFFLQDEDTHFGKVKNDLARVLKDERFQRHFEYLSRRFLGEDQPLHVVSEGRVLNSSEVMKLWLNGYVYHRDAAKRSEFEALHDDFVTPPEVTKAWHISMVLDAASCVLLLRNFIRMLQRNQVH